MVKPKKGFFFVQNSFKTKLAVAVVVVAVVAIAIVVVQQFAPTLEFIKS